MNRRRFIPGGFTLVEFLVSMALLSLVSVLLVSMTNSTASTWKYTAGKIEQFRSASNAFEAMTRRISQATLNTYWDYQYPNNDTTQPPISYVRQSELRFIAGQMQTLSGSGTPHRPTYGMFFQAPLGFVDDTTNFGGMENLLNTWGYYVEFNADTRPGFISSGSNPPPAHWRYRLMELMQPSNKMSLYSYTSGTGRYQPGIPNNWLYTSANPPAGFSGFEWFTDALNATPPQTHMLAENVIALVLLPKLSQEQDTTGVQLSPHYSYDSTKTDDANDPAGAVSPSLNWKNQLPPVVQVTMIAIDEASANRVASGSGLPFFDTYLQSPYFTDPAKLDGATGDLAALQAALSSHHVNFRVFTSNISIRAAKWSRY